MASDTKRRISRRGHNGMKDELLERLSDQSLLEYITDLSQSQSQVSRQRQGQGQVGGNTAYTREQYFTDKAARQQEQDRELRQENEQNGVCQIFRGCAVYVNGYTRPGRLQLHEMLVKHGGEFVHYLTSKKRVTHIVASNLPLKKRKEFARYKVVRPEWIVKSIEASRLLPWQTFAHSWFQQQTKLAITSCTDPNFLVSFFENSRLHHLSDWKAKLRHNFLDLNGSLMIPNEHDNLLIFHIDFDCFFATVASLDFPHLDIDKDPIVVCHGTNNSDIASCNYVARKYGIKNGMWVSGAKNYLPKDVTLNCLPYNFNSIEQKSGQFYDILKKNEYIKFDEILPISIDESICVKIVRCEKELSCSNLKTACENLRSAIFDTTDCKVSIGCSDTLIMSRLNLKKAKPNNSTIILQKDLDRMYFSDIKITDIPGIGSSTLNKLKTACSEHSNLGNVLELMKVLESNRNLIGPISEKIGVKLTKKLRLALDGKDDEESLKMIYDPKTFFERKSLSIDINWGIRFTSIYECDAFIDTCTRYLVDKLNELKKKTLQITLKIMKRAKDAPIEPAKYLGSGKCDAITKNSRLGIPTNEFGLLTTEVKNNFRCISCPPTEVRGVSIQFNKLVDVTTTPEKDSNKFINFEAFQNLPDDVKPDFANELKRRKIQIREPKINQYQEKFLNEIPTQFRNEIKKDFIINEKIKESEVNKLYEKRIQKQNLFENYKRHLLGNNNESIFETIKFQNEKSFKKICSKLMNWMDFTISDDGPHSKDLELFENYLDKLSDSNRVPLILRIAKLISNELNLKSIKYARELGFQEWEHVLLNIVIPKLNKNKHTFQTVRKLDIEFDL